MQIIVNVHELQARLRQVRLQGQSIGLVPTMGALHEGHLSLVEAAKECDIVVVSIFVNPLQFNNASDLTNYPRNITADIEMLEGRCDIVFCPDTNELYPSKPKIAVDFGELGQLLEGEFRPGHFNGVGLIVAKLFNIVQPDYAYFGLKDLQQFKLVEQLVRDLSFPVQLRGCQIIRESSGLAMSSRNQRLSLKGKDIASNISVGLRKAKEYFDQSVAFDETKKRVLSFYDSVIGLDIEYLAVVDDSFQVTEEFSNSGDLSICVAGYVEGIRLIDNLYLRSENRLDAN